MRYRVSAILKSPKVLQLFFMLLLLLIIANYFRPVLSPATSICAGVNLAGKDLGGLTTEEAKAVIEQVARMQDTPPIDCRIDPTTNGVIPGLNGLSIDVAETLARVSSAQEHETVKPVFRQAAPAVGLTAFPEHPIYQGNPVKQQVAFLINVAWGNEYLPEMLAVLKEQQAEAVFFLVGRWVQANEADARLIADAGFELGNHGYSDALSMQELTLAAATDDISRAAEVIEKVCGKRPVYFSPHRGELSADVLKAAASLKQRTVMWTVDTVDWMLPGVSVMLDKILSKAEGGSLILMHPTAQTPEFLRQVIPALRTKGLEPVSLTKLLNPMRAAKE
ncbi:MAG TPA: polysaccharide deacetylase family protein [Oscillospiraceae bacterium]|nr:polysaccharide deacetylase family protein [Oscillospiraceae bacterium]